MHFVSNFQCAVAPDRTVGNGALAKGNDLQSATEYGENSQEHIRARTVVTADDPERRT